MKRNVIGPSLAAKLLGVRVETVRRMADRGQIPHKRSPSGHRRFNRADIEAMMPPEQDRPLDEIISDLVPWMRERGWLSEGAIAIVVEGLEKFRKESNHDNANT